MAGEVFVLTDVELKRYCEVFMQLVADHGTFHRKQLIAYIEQKRGRALAGHERTDVFAYMRSLGAKPGWKDKADPFHFRPQSKRPVLPKGRRDKRTIDMFAGRAGA